eukprot:TRINITY_DN5816_c0_g1_i1.p1 TRINITY_DN5816_c0_g1~~TRINITY_DN5816_c0_g1_i1.p1  ORF type:complete len:200 (+),score=28.61 TRINITY_DN5816_c0_g1_i1:60-602(+)
MTSSPNQHLNWYYLHERKDLTNQTVALLNSHWKRSEAARLASLSKSSLSFPLNLILVSKEGETELVLGHSRLTRVAEDEKALLVESVIVIEALRGKGLGRKIMEETEKEVCKLGFSTLYLSTSDKRDFYYHLGFRECEAVTSLGENKLPKDQLAGLLGLFGTGGKSSGGPVWMKKTIVPL